MKSFARWTNALALPVATFFDLGAWYGMQSAFAPYLHRWMGPDEVGSAYAVGTAANLAGTVIGAGLTLIAGPWVVALAGLALVAAGILGVAVSPYELITVAFAVASFGHGMIRPAMFTAVAQALDGRREQARNGVFVMMWAASNAATLTTPAIASFLYDSPRLVFVASTFGTGFAFVLVLVAGIATLKGKEPDAPKPRLRSAQLGAIAGLIALGAVPWAAMQTQWEIIQSVEITGRVGLLMSMNPLVIVIVGTLLAVGFVVLHATDKRRFPTLIVVGVGALLCGLGSLALLIATGGDEPSRGLAMLGLGISSVGEVLLVPLLLSRLAADLPHRLGAVAVALFLVLAQVPSLIGWALGDPSVLTRPLGWVGVASGLVVGLAFIGSALPLQRIFRPEDDPDAAAPTSF